MKLYLYNNCGVFLNTKEVSEGVVYTNSTQIPYINNTIFSEELQEWVTIPTQKVKDYYISSIKVMDYIHTFYPQWKQMSDASDKENGDSYLVMLGGDNIAVRKKIAEIVTSNATFIDGLKDLLATFPTPVDATHWEYWLEQLLKIGYRQFFVFNVKQEYKAMVEAINKATTVEELNTIDTTFKTVYPL